MSNEVRLYAVLSESGEVVKTSHGLYYFTRAKARLARKEIEGKARIVKRVYNSDKIWDTAK